MCVCLWGGGEISGSTIAGTGCVVLIVITDERAEN
jgi:chemotaxis protein histidine kinase CheA